VVVAQRTPSVDLQLPFSYPDVQDLRQALVPPAGGAASGSGVFADLMGYKEEMIHLSLTGESTERAFVHAATENYFSLLGVQPYLGRFFLPTEGRAVGADPVIVLTYDTWTRRFGGNPSIVGQTLKLNGIPFIVIGVAPRGFYGASYGTALSGFIPITMLPKLVPGGEYWRLNRGELGPYLVGRLAPGATLEQARSATDTAYNHVMNEHPGYYAPSARSVVMFEQQSRPSPAIAHHAPQILGALCALALMVLTVAVANVANLLFARTSTREHELAIRSAIGARRRQLIRSLLAESMVLALVAGAVGVFAALWLGAALASTMPSLPNAAPMAPSTADWRPFVFTAASAVIVGLITGLLPALRASNVSPLVSLKDSGNSHTGRRHPLRSVLVVVQVAVSCMVLVGSALALRSFVVLSRAPVGFQVDRITLASFDLGLQNYGKDDGLRFQTRLLERLRSLPEVESASLTTATPLDPFMGQWGGVTAAGASKEETQAAPPVNVAFAERECLRTLGVHIERGRDFTTQDRVGSPLVVIVNQSLAQRLFPGQNPVGRHIALQGNDAEVIGVVGPNRYVKLTDASVPLLFGLIDQTYRSGVSVVVRTRVSTAPIGPTIERVLHELDPDLPIYGVHTLADQVNSSPLGLMPFRAGAIMAGAQGGIALLLAGAGIFGLVAFAVTRRTREIGIRVALGASRFDVMRDVAMNSLVLVLIGLAVGAAISLAASRALSGLLAGVGHGDGWIVGGVASLVLLTALAACWLPARRATLINPVDALRAE
jgi:predicted permease